MRSGHKVSLRSGEITVNRFGDTTLTDAGNLLFMTTLVEAPNDFVLLYGAPEGPFDILAQPGEEVPGISGATISHPGNRRDVNKAGTVATQAYLNGASIDDLNREVILEINVDNGIEPVARSGGEF